MGDRRLATQGQQPIQVVIPEEQLRNSGVTNIYLTVESPQTTVHNTTGRSGGKGWLLIIIMAAICYDWYANDFGYTKAAKDWVVQRLPQPTISQTQVPTGRPMNPGTYAGISSGFGNRVLGGVKGFHGGVDYIAPVGTSVIATAQGKVTRTGALDNNCGYGVKVNHGNGYETIVCHLSKITVAKGVQVQRGDELGKSGGMPGTKGSGRSSGPHIHYAIKLNGKIINPTKLAAREPAPRPVVCKAPRNTFDAKAVLEYVECEGARAGLPRGYMATMAMIETGGTGDPTAYNESSQAAGIYQLLPKTALELGVDNPYNVKQAVKGAIKYTKTFTPSQVPVILYMQHNQGVCGYEIIKAYADKGSHNMQCGGVTHTNAKIYTHMLGNTNGKHKRTVRWQGKLNRKSANAYIKFMTDHKWPQGVRQWKRIISQ